MTAAVPYPGTQAVARAVALLKAFSHEQPHLGLAELARVVGLNKTTTYRLLTALEREGLIARDAHSGNYRLGPEIIALGARALRATDLRAIGRPELEALAHATGETADVEVLVGGDVFILDEVQGTFVVGTGRAIGTRWPAHATSTGKAILAHLPQADFEAALPRRLAAPTEKTIGNRDDLRADLARVRERGYATAIEELEENFAAVGAPVFDHDGRVVGAISLGGPRHRVTSARIPELAELVTGAAARISDKLGYRRES